MYDNLAGIEEELRATKTAHWDTATLSKLESAESLVSRLSTENDELKSENCVLVELRAKLAMWRARYQRLGDHDNSGGHQLELDPGCETTSGGRTGTGGLAGGSAAESAAESAVESTTRIVPTWGCVGVTSCESSVPMGVSLAVPAPGPTVVGAGAMGPASTLDGAGVMWTTVRAMTTSTTPTYVGLEQTPQMTTVPIVPSVTTAYHGQAGTLRPTPGGVCAPTTAGSRPRYVKPSGTLPLPGGATCVRDAGSTRMVTKTVPVISSEHVRVEEPHPVLARHSIPVAPQPHMSALSMPYVG